MQKIASPLYKTQKHMMRENISSLTSHFLPIVLVLSMKSVFVKIKNSIFPPKYTRYDINVGKQNSLFQRDLQILWEPFSYKNYIFCLFIKNVIKKKPLISKITIQDTKKMLETELFISRRYTDLLFIYL